MFSEWPVEANSGMAVEVENSLSSTVLVNSMYGDMISRFNLHKLKRKMNGDRDVKEGHGDEDDVGKELKSFCDRMITQRSIKWAVSRDKYYGYLRYRQRILDDLPGTSELLRALTDRREYPHVFFHNKDDHRDIYLLSNISGVYDNFVENEKNIFTCMFYVINGFIYTSEGDNVNVSDIDGKLRAKILPPVVSKDNVEVSFFAKDNCIYVIGNSKKKNDTLEIYYMIVKQVN